MRFLTYAAFTLYMVIVVDIASAEELQIMGISERDALVAAGFEGDKLDQENVCSNNNNGNLPNRLCHIWIGEIANELTGSKWSGFALLIAKELTDDNVSLDDIWIGPISLNRKGEIRLVISPRLDFIISFSKDF